jgi:hypothetical protein
MERSIEDREERTMVRQKEEQLTVTQRLSFGRP